MGKKPHSTLNLYWLGSRAANEASNSYTYELKHWEVNEVVFTGFCCEYKQEQITNKLPSH